MNTWDEKNYTKPKSNCLNNSEQEPSDTTKITKSDSMQPQWIDIGGVKKWIRNCPECGGMIYHGRKDHRDAQVRKNATCKKCQSKKAELYKLPDILERNCPICKTIIIYRGKNNGQARRSYRRAVNENRICTSCSQAQKLDKIKYYWKGKKGARLGTHLSEDKKQKIREMRKGKPGPRKGMVTPESTKEKLRNIRLDNFEKTGIVSYNPKACKYLNELSEKMGWNLQHAENGGEHRICGFRLDGYDKNRNIVVEYDESYHYRYGELLEKDVERMKIIINALKCEFYRYDEKRNEFKKYN
jgi:hypothetical protein